MFLIEHIFSSKRLKNLDYTSLQCDNWIYFLMMADTMNEFKKEKRQSKMQYISRVSGKSRENSQYIPRNQ
jgi:hypothetical protein